MCSFAGKGKGSSFKESDKPINLLAIYALIEQLFSRLDPFQIPSYEGKYPQTTPYYPPKLSTVRILTLNNIFRMD